MCNCHYFSHLATWKTAVQHLDFTPQAWRQWKMSTMWIWWIAFKFTWMQRGEHSFRKQCASKNISQPAYELEQITAALEWVWCLNMSHMLGLVGDVSPTCSISSYSLYWPLVLVAQSVRLCLVILLLPGWTINTLRGKVEQQQPNSTLLL